jgi:FkbM family methyltransferase
MIDFDKWKLPDGERHLQDWMRNVNRRVNGRLTYQYGKYDEALKFVKSRRTAVDIGAHVGLWSWFMARDFRQLEAFEPSEKARACWQRNMIDRPNAYIHPHAVGDKAGLCSLVNKMATSSGGAQIVPGSDLTVVTLDAVGLTDVDFIKLDCEGYEIFALEGARKTLEEFRPCVIVEQKPGMTERFGREALAAVKFLQGLGAQLRLEISGDYILSWD